MKKIIYFILSLFLLGQTQVMAHEWKIDPIHSGVLFEIKHIYSTVRGHFSDFSGEVIFDPDNLEKSKFDFVVNVDSIDTNNEKRDTHLRSNDFFAANKYPMMTFKSSRVSHAGGNKYILEGKMTIKDVTKDMVLEFIYWTQKENPVKKNEMVAGFDTRFNINRFDFHMENGKFYNVRTIGIDVDISMTFDLSRKK